MKRASRIVLALSLLACGFAVPGVAHATCSSGLQSCSTDYGVSQTYFGAGGDLDDCSSNYCAKSSVGELGVGNSSSANYQVQAGFNTTDQPYLAFIITNVNTDLGVLSASSTAYTTATFSVKTYLSSGYAVQTASAPPSYNGHTINTLTSPTASATGSEQFGMNLVDNNSCGGGLPTSLGANPVQVPDSSFSFGQVASGYNTACEFQYNQYNTIASSSRSSGETDYTISYIFNISQKTPAGRYAFDDVLVATSTY